MSIKVKFISEVEVKDGKKTLKAAKNANIKINDSCEGKGKCGKCVVKILEGKLSEPTKQELKVLGQEKIDKGYRLSCQTTILEDSVIEVINGNEIKVNDDNSAEIKEGTVSNKVEISKANIKKVKDDNRVEIKKDTVSNKVETRKDNIKEINDDNSVEIKEDADSNKVEVRKANGKEIKTDNNVELKEDTKVEIKENSKVLTRKNKKPVK